MRVHVVCSQRESDRILPRMARHLAELDGWTTSAKPDPAADVNYYLGYTELAGHKLPNTKTAAYFTHRETGGKGALWDKAAKSVDLRIVTAAQYREMLEPAGLTVQVPPPVELDHFTPASARPQRKVPVIGVSGWVYPGGRKGEKLVKQVAEKLGKRVEWKAAGRGWPVPTTRYAWDKLPGFYRSLDVYFCAATVEGVPMPPLEALACGIPVVIPSGVGMLDDLLEQHGVYHYDAGDLDDAVATIGHILQRPADGEKLRAVVSRYTPEAWRAAHLEAFAMLNQEAKPDAYGYVVPDISIKPPTGPTVLPPLPRFVPLAQDVDGVGVHQKSDRGIYVVAYGGPARECARRLLASLRVHMPDIPVMLAGDEPLNAGEALFAEAPRGDIGARSVKVQIYDRAPAEWQYVLYLDADTELVAPVPFLFKSLEDGWEFVICKNPSRFHVAQHMARPDNVDECRETFRLWGTDQMMQWNGGVFGFRRCDSTRDFFAAWYREWLRYGKRDQAALLRALWQHPLRMLPLGNEWNLVPAYDPVNRSAGIVHHVTEAREWGKGIIPQRGDSPEAFAAVARNRRFGKGTPHVAIVGSRTQRIVRNGGPLVRVEVKPGQFVKVTEKEAARLQAIVEEKARRQVQNKMLMPAENK